MAEIELGIGKTARRAYGFDEISIVPSRRTRDRDDAVSGGEHKGDVSAILPQ